MPKISILLPIFNEDNNILEQSIKSIIDQTFKDWECLCVVESTNIENHTLIKDYGKKDKRFILIKPKNRIGLSASLNLAASFAKAKILARMDSDDMMC